MKPFILVTLMLSMPLGILASNEGPPADAGCTDKKGHITVNSKPSGLEFELLDPNNVALWRGPTPAPLNEIEPGLYTVVFRKKDRAAQRYAVTVGVGRMEITGDFSLQDELDALRKETEGQQAIIDIGNQIATKVGPNLLRDLALLVVDNNAAVKDLLARHGYTVAGGGGAPKGAAAKANNSAPPDKNPASAPAPEGVTSSPVPRVAPDDLAPVDWTPELQDKWKTETAQLLKVKAEREPLVKRSQEIQAKLQQLCVDLLEVAKTDAGAAKVVEKYKIVQAPPAGPKQ